MSQDHSDRSYWLATLCRIAEPVLHHLAIRNLKQAMPVAGAEDRRKFMHLEALGRLLSGIAPWLESGGRVGEEGILRERYAELARRAIDAGTDPASPDFMNFSQDGKQPIVDSAFLAHALIRAPQELWNRLELPVRDNVVKALASTRKFKPAYNNWLLFAAMIETALYRAGADWDRMRVDYALRQHEQWYKGDGVYGDGATYAADYYNSFVIQPMLIDILDTLGHEDPAWTAMREKAVVRGRRHATQQERMISPEGTFPPIGRSLVYRFGAFQHLSQMALQHRLEDQLDPAQVRCALTAVIRRVIEMPGTFDESGWLTKGFCGRQPETAEHYISTGSLYLCSTVFLPLGLPPEDPFWQGEAEWTAKKAWSGQSFPIDRALHDLI